MRSLVRPAVVLFVLMSVLTGIIYPLAVSGVARVVFREKSEGSLITRSGRTVGSSLIGQEFTGEPKYFWGRLSATSPAPYTAFNADKSAGSSGSNLGPINPALVDNVKARVDALSAADAAVGYQRAHDEKVPVDLVTASGSGLDPHISLAGAEYQIPRVARARGITEDALRALVRTHTEDRTFGVLGEPVINVLQLNLELDREAHQ